MNTVVTPEKSIAGFKCNGSFTDIVPTEKSAERLSAYWREREKEYETWMIKDIERFKRLQEKEKQEFYEWQQEQLQCFLATHLDKITEFTEHHSFGRSDPNIGKSIQKQEKFDGPFEREFLQKEQFPNGLVLRRF